MDWTKRISELAQALDRAVPPARAAELGRFADLVHTWNAKVNLTAAREPVALVEVLFADAIVLADEELTPRGARVVDVGSGAGAPAVPLALLRADLDVTMIEPLRKRVAFLRTAIGSLGLAARVRVMEARVDSKTVSRIEGVPFDLALSRATLAPEDWLALGLGLAPRVLVLTASDAPAPPDGATRDADVRYALPSTSAPRRISRYVTA